MVEQNQIDGITKMHIWKPNKVKGKDGKEYWMYTIFGAGRGWYNRMFFTPLDGQYREIEVEILSFNFHNHKGTLVNILTDRDLKMIDFSRNPSQSRDGNYQHVNLRTSPDGYQWGVQELKKKYAVHFYEKVEPYMDPNDNWYKNVISIIQQRGSLCMVEVETKQIKEVKEKAA